MTDKIHTPNVICIHDVKALPSIQSWFPRTEDLEVVSELDGLPGVGRVEGGMPFRALAVPKDFEISMQYTARQFRDLAQALAKVFPEFARLARMAGPPARVPQAPPVPAPGAGMFARRNRSALLRSHRRALRRNAAWTSRLDRRQPTKID